VEEMSLGVLPMDDEDFAIDCSNDEPCDPGARDCADSRRSTWIGLRYV
jgi:hypothetical protein